MTFSISSVCIGLSSLMMLAFGCVYFFKSGYMPYHVEALKLEWQDVPAGYQGIILGLMRSTGGGLIAGGLMCLVLQYQFQKSPQLWIALTILVGGIILCLGAFFAMWLFIKLSNGKPPVIFAITALVLFVIGNVMNFIKLRP